MLEFLNKLKTYLFDNEHDLRLRIFMFAQTATLLLLGITTIELWLCDSSFRLIIMLSGVVILFAITGSIAIRTKKINIGAIPMIIMMGFLHFTSTFFFDGGINGVAPLWFIYDCFLIAVMLTGKLRVIFFVLMQLTGLACYWVSYKYPESVSTTMSKTLLSRNIYSFSVLFMSCVALAILIFIIETLYESQNRIAEKQKKEIEALNASQNRFFSSMSHEIRTPINTIIGLNEMILREDISDEVAEDAINIRVAGKLLLNLINDILDMSKVQAGDMHILVDAYDTGNMLSEIVGSLWIRAKEKNLEFKINVAPDVPAELMGDEVRIKQILMNVVNNAIKYTKEGSVALNVSCEKNEDDTFRMIYSVSDTGMGIKKEDIPYLFTAFKRVNEDSTKHIEGTGLGLSIVKQLLDLMGGKVTVNSVYTKGSTFIIEIPQKAASDRTIGEYDYTRNHSLVKRGTYKQKFEAPEARILAVDDNASNLMVVTKLLRDTKVMVETASNGVEALKMTLNTEYDLVLMDHLMPEMDGIECYQNIQTQAGGKNKKTKVVVLTANADEESRMLYAQTGFAGYLVKPISGDELESELIKLLPREKVKITGETEGAYDDSMAWMNVGRKKRILITTDSAADIPNGLLEKYNIRTVSHEVHTAEGTIFKDGLEIDTRGVLSYMRNEDHHMKSVCPDVKTYESFFADNLQYANNIIHISISANVSSEGYPNCVAAAESFDNVTIIDSTHVSSGEGLLALYAAMYADSNKSVPEVVEYINNLKHNIQTSFIVDNLSYMARNDQVSKRTANLLNSLMIRPVIRTKKGKLTVDKIYFGSSKNAWKKYIKSKLAKFDTDSKFLFVTYVGINHADIEWIRKEISDKIDYDNVIFMQASPSIAVNCGPGTFGMLYLQKETE
jgi:DegV family protein with EDD domain